jgi:four helix bundle protein
VGDGAMSEQKAAITSYRDLIVWQEAMNLAEMVYRLTERFPKDEAYGLTSQLRRAGTSIPANIAEGYGRDSKGAYLQHLRVAQGSLKEFETHVLLAERVDLADKDVVAALLAKSEVVGKLLRGLIRALENSG